MTLRDLPDGSFDAVLSDVVFQHVSSLEAVHAPAFDRSWCGHRFGGREISALATRTGCAAMSTSHGRHLWLVLRR